MQSTYFVIPDVDNIFAGFERIKEIKKLLDNGYYHIDRDYVEAKSLATVAYIVLQEASKIASENAELTSEEN